MQKRGLMGNMVKAYSSDALSLSFANINGGGELHVYADLGFPPPPPPSEEKMSRSFGSFCGVGTFNRGRRENFQYVGDGKDRS